MTAIIKSPFGAVLRRGHPLARGLVGCWLFNEGNGNMVSDLSGNGLTADLSNNITWQAGRQGHWLHLNGTTDFINANANPIGTSACTIVAWIWPEGWGENVTYGGLIATNGKVYFGVRDSGDRLYFSGDGGSTQAVSTDSSIALNTFQCVAAARTATGVTNFYVNGLTSGTANQASGTPQAPSLNLAFGARPDNNAYAFDGKFSQILVYTRVLAAAEIAWLHREPFCMIGPRPLAPLLAAPSGGTIHSISGTITGQSVVSGTAKILRSVSGSISATSSIGGTATVEAFSATAAPQPWFREALLNGMTDTAFKLGTVITRGWFWVRRSGCSAVYRGTNGAAVDFGNILGVAEPDMKQISLPAWLSHDPDCSYCYVVRRFNSCGYQEKTAAATVAVKIGPDGRLAKPGPNGTVGLKGEQTNGDELRLVWFYCPLDQKAGPTVFNVYFDGGSGQVDLENPVAVVRYEGRKFYCYHSDALGDGRYLFMVKVAGETDVEDIALLPLSRQVKTQSPKPVTILAAEII